MNTVGTKDEEYNPCSFSKVMQSLDDYQKLLDDVKQSLDKFSMESLLLNAELVTMFDPIKTEELENVVFECEACAEKMELMKNQDIEQLATSQ